VSAVAPVISIKYLTETCSGKNTKLLKPGGKELPGFSSFGCEEGIAVMWLNNATHLPVPGQGTARKKDNQIAANRRAETAGGG